MKRIAIILAVAVIVSLLGASVASAGVDRTGNGAPSGPHYNLNIIGVPNDKNVDPKWDTGNRIFVDLGAKNAAAGTKILLSEAEDFNGIEVIDANGTDGVAAFALPNPDEDGDGTTSYSVFVRALGKPGGKATVQSCYDDQQTGETWCAVDYNAGVDPVTVERQNENGKGKSSFDNVSKDLLYVDVCTSYDTVNEVCLAWDQLPLFSDELDQYFWQYDNEGLKLAQFRFYEIPTDAW